MLDSFYQWILNEKASMYKKGIEIEELVYRTDCTLPFVKVILNTMHYIGQICLYDNKLLDLEILNLDNFKLESKLDFYEHHEVEQNTNWSALLSNFLNFMLQNG